MAWSYNSSTCATSALAALVTESRTSCSFQGDYITWRNSTTNLLIWQNQASIYLCVIEIYKYIPRSTPTPHHSAQLATCTGKHYRAKAGILSFCSGDLIYLVHHVPIVTYTWKAVENYQDYRNSSTHHPTGLSFCGATMYDNDILTAYISSYEQMHIYPTKPSRRAKNWSLHAHLLLYLKFKETIIPWSRLSLPPAIDDRVDNLQFICSLT